MTCLIIMPHFKKVSQSARFRQIPPQLIGTFCRELCKNGWTFRFAIWAVDSGGPKEAQVQSYSPNGANVHKFSRISQVAPVCMMTLCHELCKNGWSDQFAVWVVDSGGPKKAQVQSYSPAGTLAQPANTFEPSVCCGDSALCQITLTTYYY